jgi:hypothetical protein
MTSTASPPRPRLPTVFSIYRPIEEYWDVCGLAQQFGSEPDRMFNPLDAFLIHLILDLLPDVPVLIDLAVECTGGASSVLGLLHPRVQAVVAGPSSVTADADQVFRALDEYQRRYCPAANLAVRPTSAFLATASLPPRAVILADARRMEAHVLADAVSAWCDAQPDVLVLVLGLGTVGACPALEAVLRVCSVHSGRRFWLTRELEGSLSASNLAVIAPQSHPDADEILFRIQQLYTSNHQFLHLLCVANQVAMESAQVDGEVMESHPSAHAIKNELHEWRRNANAAQEQVRQHQEKLGDTHQRLAEAQANETELRRALEQAGAALTQTTTQVSEVTHQLETIRQSFAFRTAGRLHHCRRWLAPELSWRFRLYQKTVQALRIWRSEGLGRLLRRVARKCLGRNTR